ncbi:septation protein IspZ [Pseudoalteromonas sp. McH1-7]|uniref:Inner membrane-spanning protein YciB n=1 Tax=Pseudoalteromonas peptidolytica F12-50-A1 TaxID=1315280 RepID=A0A8I0MWE3_9GAMM|nr:MULTISPECIES: inner membrane-spanning protein YciB [Pseudoalteromonas]MBE0346733.1 intracellular septation protein [Pseudoalteromonas peptidolytica F12-50-A1]MDW7549911.1 inner membrane-spanning protein YciB [Pseudoalteromonas peptidolytica]NLR13644.1 septation protein IspZ [Pseudoalteromonas peptidolytica]NUZ09451.1 septation protein IspZ [Pseudoalteromonas sp. McH1-7]USD29754.1 septation protein IspZ [Pseudoalteromonas sp. SCSIO 43201]
MSFLIEYLPLILFFTVYKFVDIFWATGVLIVASLIQVTHQYFTKGEVAKRHWIFLAIAIILGGMTILFHDEQFIKWKATIVYAILGSALIVSKYLFNKNLVKTALEGVLSSVAEKEQNQNKITLPEKDCDQLNLFWSVLFFFIAALNIYVAYNFSLDFWVNFKVFGLIGLTFVALLFTMFKIQKYLPED